MHPVIEHILERKNKNYPFNDGRKISLCLYGGMMRGIRGIAALFGLEEIGLGNVFDDIYTFSAGFPNAAYFLSGQSDLGSSIYYQDLVGRKFINFWRFWRVADIDYLINIMREKKPLNISKLFGSNTKLYVRLKNISENKDEYKEMRDFGVEKFWSLMKAATSVPVLHPGGEKINGIEYDDAAKLDNSHWLKHFQYVNATKATDILVICNHPGETYYSKENESDRVCYLSPSASWKLSKFETRGDVLKKAVDQIKEMIKSDFNV